MSRPGNTLSQRMGLMIPANNVVLDPENERGVFGGNQSWKNYTLREICCVECGSVLFAVLSEDIFLADLVWPIRVACEGGGVHRTTMRAEGEDAGTVCKGRALNESDAKTFLARYVR